MFHYLISNPLETRLQQNYKLFKTHLVYFRRSTWCQMAFRKFKKFIQMWRLARTRETHCVSYSLQKLVFGRESAAKEIRRLHWRLDKWGLFLGKIHVLLHEVLIHIVIRAFHHLLRVIHHGGCFGSWLPVFGKSSCSSKFCISKSQNLRLKYLFLKRNNLFHYRNFQIRHFSVSAFRGDLVKVSDITLLFFKNR